jgi:hypothetical protein
VATGKTLASNLKSVAGIIPRPFSELVEVAITVLEVCEVSVPFSSEHTVSY